MKYKAGHFVLETSEDNADDVTLTFKGKLITGGCNDILGLHLGTISLDEFKLTRETTVAERTALGKMLNKVVVDTNFCTSNSSGLTEDDENLY